MNWQELPLDVARNRVVNTADAAAYIGVDVQMFRRMVGSGSLPTPIKLSERVRGWRIGELSDWIAARAAERGAS